jgi:hypothetical protein
MTRRFIAALTSVHEPVHETKVQKGKSLVGRVGRVGLEPRPADYEKCGPMLHAL